MMALDLCGISAETDAYRDNYRAFASMSASLSITFSYFTNRASEVIAKPRNTRNTRRVATVRYNESFHDRFLIIDDKELYLIGASLKDLGQKCFAFTKLDAGEIRRIKKTAFGRGGSSLGRRNIYSKTYTEGSDPNAANLR
jgi:hypothetical protein